MNSKKLSTFFLSLLLVFTLVIAAGCEKDPNEDEKKPESQEGQKQNETGKQEGQTNNNSNNNNNANNTNNNSNASNTTKKTVKLLKRNGVEWKENTRINSSRGAKSYKVVWGDTLSLIARTWHVNCYKLAKYNGIKNIDLIEVDQIIYNYAAK